jgi:GntR family transcriptional regulator/MocR family aminotransferase
MNQPQIQLDSKSTIELRWQVYHEIRHLIETGEWLAGTRLPSSRQLADLLGVSRKTVIHAYEQLTKEGYLEGRSGSGTFVNKALKNHKIEGDPHLPGISKSKVARDAKKTNHSIHLSRYAKELLSLPQPRTREAQPEIQLFNWQNTHSEMPTTPLTEFFAREFVLAQRNFTCSVRDPRGYEPLRCSIVAHLQKTRGVKCSPEQVLIVSGLQQAVDLTARVQIEPGSGVVFEEPCYPVVRTAFRLYGAKIVPVPVDEQGILVRSVVQKKRTKQIALAYVTPSHHFPTGVILSLARRLELLDWAEKQNTLIFEDDYDSEFGYTNLPVPALQGLRDGHSVIYFGSFSKVLVPTLSLGYLIVPKPLADVYYKAIVQLTDQLPLQLQHAIAGFIDSDNLERHVKRLRAHYGKRREALMEALKAHLGERVKILGDPSGLHVLIELKSNMTDEQLIERAAELGVGLVSTASFYSGKPKPKEFVIGYANLTEEAIDKGIRILRRALTSKR